jgi:hypothetical protein
MAQDYTMTEAGLSPATSAEYRAAFKRAKRLFDASQRRPSFNQGAARILSEDIEPGLPKRPIPCIYPEKMPRPYGPATGFNLVPDYDNLGDIAWMKATRDTLVIIYRGADGGEGTVRLPMPFEHEDAAGFNERKSDYLRKLTGGSGVIDTRSVVDALRADTSSAPKATKATKAPKATKASEQTSDIAAMSRVAYLESVVTDLRAEIFRLTADLNEAREAADTDAADATLARATVDDLRAEINTLRHLRLKVDAPPVLLSKPIARA